MDGATEKESIRGDYRSWKNTRNGFPSMTRRQDEVIFHSTLYMCLQSKQQFLFKTKNLGLSSKDQKGIRTLRILRTRLSTSFSWTLRNVSDAFFPVTTHLYRVVEKRTKQQARRCIPGTMNWLKYIVVMDRCIRLSWSRSSPHKRYFNSCSKGYHSCSCCHRGLFRLDKGTNVTHIKR